MRSGELTGAASRYWSLAPGLSLPIFAGGRLRQAVKSAEAERDAALESYRSSVLGAFADAESALIRYAADRSRAERLRDARAQLERVHALTVRRETAGDVAHTEVLDAAQSRDQAADAALAAAGQAIGDFIALEKALGGGWQAER